MHLRSPGAYNYLREKFNYNLPHESTIRKWYANSSSNGGPGIQQDCLETLSKLVSTAHDTEKEVYCSLCYDEVAIKQLVQWSDARKKFMGYQTYGADNESKIASQAIVFLITGINFIFSIPVAYHFIGNLNQNQKAELLKEIITAITNVGIVVVNLTFDGLSTNLQACVILGSSFVLSDFRPFFPNPVNGSRVHVILDACHMLKLWRNTLANIKTIKDGNGNVIDWHFLEKLEYYRTKNDFITHKLTKCHILWYTNKMNVRLAAQTLSDSVSKSLLYLRETNCPGFRDCGATAEFAKRANDIFDIFNTRKTEEKDSENGMRTFKNEILCETNSAQIFSHLENTASYIKGLKIGTTEILKSRNKTGFIGFLINIDSLKGIYEDFIVSKRMNDIPTLRLSQDFLESLFGRIRALLGSNNHPTQEQFISAFRKMLVNSELAASRLSNCTDQLSILHVSSRKKSQTGKTSEENIEAEVEGLHQINENDYLLDMFQQSSIGYTAGSIENQILNYAYFDCADCSAVLKENESSGLDFFKSKKHRVPCKSTVDICIVANRFVKIFENDMNFNYQSMINKILQSIDFDTIYPKSVEHEAGHMYYFVRFIIEEYARIKLTYIAKTKTLSNQKKFLRNKLKNEVKRYG